MADRYPLVGVEQGVVLVAGRVFGLQGKTKDVILLLDTGASMTTIRESILAEIGVDLNWPKSQRRVETMGGPVIEGIATVPRLRILGQEQVSLDVIFTRRPFPYRVDGVLGLNFLKDYRLCVDFPNRWIELACPAEASDPVSEIEQS